MKRKLVVATLGLALIFSSVVGVATVRAFVFGTRVDDVDYRQQFAFAQARQYARYAQEPPLVEPLPPRPEIVAGQPRRQPLPPGETGQPGGSIPIDAPRFEDQFPSEFDLELYRRSRNTFRLGQDLTITSDDVVRDAAVVFGNATVAGRVTGDLVVIFGTAKLTSTAVIDGDFVSIGGASTVEPGASVRRDVVVIGGPMDAPGSFAAGGGQIVIGPGILGGSLEGLVPYLSRGLAWGRVIVPDLPWVWGIVAIFFLLYAALNLVFDRPVRACALTMHNRPLTTFGAGLLVLLLFGPICVLLAISLIGIAVVPFLICALIAGGIIGKVAVARFIGMSAVEEEDGNRAHAARSFVIGFAVLTIAYMIPLVGIIVWALAAVMGLGSSTLAFMTAYRRENPAKPPVVVASVPPPAAPPSAPSYPGGPAGAPATAFDGSAAAIPTAPPPLEASPAPMGAPYAAYAPGAAAIGATTLLVAQPRAMFRDRLASFIVDVFVVFVATAFLDEIGVLDGEAFFPILLVYMIISWAVKQTTLGGVLCQIRLVRTDGTPLSFADALVRGLAGVVSLLIFAIGALWILRDPERQAWHDKIAGTYVVKVPRGWPV
jgi:uncharacterized RDD family membrane protein YckC